MKTVKIQFRPQLLLGLALALAACSPASSGPTPEATITAFVVPTTAAPPTPDPTEPDATLDAIDIPSNYQSGDLRVSSLDGMEQIFVDAGEFILGSEDEEAKTSDATGGVASVESPEQVIYLDAFWIDKYEVTNAQYRLCVEAGDCKPPNLMRSFLEIEYYPNPEYAEYPVVYVDYYMARDYCSWAGRRLPTEAEWEKAARGPDGFKFPWGNDPVNNERVNFCDTNCPKEHANPSFDDGYAETAPVGSFPAGASPYGAMDMSGNVWEWTSTIPWDYPYDATDGREEPDLRSGSCSPPDCAEGEVPFGDGPQRVWRGGTWANGNWWVRATVRYHSVPGYWHNSLGFRCAQSAD